LYGLALAVWYFSLFPGRESGLFQQRVWSELTRIAYGATASYGEIAAIRKEIMDKLKHYQELMNAYDIGNELPAFITRILDQQEAMVEIRKEVEDVPIDFNGSADELKKQYKERCMALALRDGSRQIDDRFERLLEQRLSSAVEVGMNRLIKSLSEKVAADLDSLNDAGAMERLLVLVDSLPNQLDMGLIPSTSRLMAIVKIEGSSSIVSASARAWEKESRTDRRAALRNIKEGYYPYLSLVFISGLDDLTQRRKDLGDLLASPTRVV